MINYLLDLSVFLKEIIIRCCFGNILSFIIRYDKIIVRCY